MIPDKAASLEKICIAAAFHDLGIWTAQTFDYIEPSKELARLYLGAIGKDVWKSEITSMIGNHHKITQFVEEPMGLTESFRRADLIDISLGIRTFGVSRSFISLLQRSFPNAGFHRRLFELTGKWFCSNPLNPFPMFRW